MNHAPALAPFGQAACHAARVEAALAEVGEGPMGVDPIGATAIGDDLSPGVERGQEPVWIVQCRVLCAGDLAYGEFVLGADVEQGDGALREPFGKVGAGDRLGRGGIPAESVDNIFDLR